MKAAKVVLAITEWLDNRRRDVKYWLNKNIMWPLQRAKYGFAPNNTWEFDHYLSDIIIGGLTYLRDHTHGYPCRPDADGIETNAAEKWHAELTEVIQAFQDYQDYCDKSTERWKEYEAANDRSARARKGYRDKEDKIYKDIKLRLHKLIDIFDNLWD